MLYRVVRFLPLVALAAAVLLVVVLAVQNRTLRVEAAKLCESATQAYPGFVVPTFGTTTLGGDFVSIGNAPAGELQVLFVFGTSGGECFETIRSWKAIVEELHALRAREVPVYGISLDSEPKTRRYVVEHGLLFPILRFPERKLASLYRVTRVPLTLVLNHDGTVVHARLGPLTGQASIDSLISTIRPGRSPMSVTSE
ncbi:MAG: redoxin domain-containing protein [Gemmatimonadota bacterium]|nr:MAG: redoxin domain-containing protein [Gemmatimonadota bacterium]